MKELCLNCNKRKELLPDMYCKECDRKAKKLAREARKNRGIGDPTYKPLRR